ncbi:amiloride-sensitive amine oxidase [copper-containing]-like [Ruditapes philippinarum]|uniref:amiloride-sensitive amine oxidase [copper-containing]-like n=1 Tax=Ruditapes philippinarum TaxID=129788 RepID=UPI00295B2C5D|nr:amiloride-sensitive amine oxidase [copper-containing]-like [Ruditapes philippinarum]
MSSLKVQAATDRSYVYTFVVLCIGFLAGIMVGMHAFDRGPESEDVDDFHQSKRTIQTSQERVLIKGFDSRNNFRSTKKRETHNQSNIQGSNPFNCTEKRCKKCPKGKAKQPWNGQDPQIFAPLTADEMIKVNDFMVTNNYADNLTAMSSLSLNINFLTFMYLYLPNKTAVLEYKAGQGKYPGRYARVHVARGARAVPDYMEYKVGPLRANIMTAEQLYNDGELVFNSRPFDNIEYGFYIQLLSEEIKILEPLTIESFDGAYYPRENNDLQFWLWNGPPGALADERETRVIALLNPLAPNGADLLELDFLPLSATIHCPGTDFHQWYIYDFYYLNQGPFPNATALLNAYQNGSLRKFTLPDGYRETVLDRHLPDRDTDQPFRRNSFLSTPRTYEPDGPRYIIRGYNVDWMDWNFDVTAGQIRGPGLFEVSFKGNKIAYEISLNEIALTYGSGSSGQTNVIYADSSFAIGNYNGIIKSVDCPKHATLLETSHWEPSGASPVVTKSICVFEADGENALWRHKAYEFQGGLRNNYLVVRVSSTIANYDYIVEWHFQLDGKVFTIVTASGLIQATFWDHENPFMGSEKGRDAFGYRVGENAHGQIHDHMFGFKVDLDVLGTDNSMEVIHWKNNNVLSALRSQVPNVSEAPKYFLDNWTRYIEYELVENETGKRINMDEPEFWVIVNENERNKWGNMRGYEIKPIATAAQTLSDNHPAMPALSFTKYHCAITKRKEDEQYLDSSSDTHRLDKPIEDLEKMLNGESIRNTDVVNWVSIGFLHVPTSEDVPMTIRVEAAFMLKPFNFFNTTPVFDLQGHFDTKTLNKTGRPPKYTPCLEKIQ